MRVWFSFSESHPEAKIHAARHREIAEVDTRGPGSTHSCAVPVHDWIEPSVVGDKEEVRAFDKHAGGSRADESVRKTVAHLNVSEPYPVDVLLDEELFTHVGVIGRLNRGDNDDGVDRWSRGILFSISQDAFDYPRRVSIQRRRRQTSRRQVMLRRIEHVSPSPEIEQEIQREPFVPERIRQTKRVI